jgi:hypothetical protein
LSAEYDGQMQDDDHGVSVSTTELETPVLTGWARPVTISMVAISQFKQIH